MKKALLAIMLLLIITACSLISPATPTSDPTDTPIPVTLTDMPTPRPTRMPPTPVSSPSPASKIYEVAQKIGRAVNLGNALEAPNEGEWGVTLKEDYFVQIKDAGFDSVRIPIRFSAHAERTHPYTLESEFLARIDWAIDNALKNDLNAIIDLHHYEEIMIEPEKHRERFLGLWQQLAERYQDTPNSLYFEPLNEPNGNLEDVIWNDLLADVIAIIRETNPIRPIIVGPDNWNNLSRLEFLHLPDDDNLIVTFHYYLPFQFTHQGAEWVNDSQPWLGTTWDGSQADRFVMNTDFSQVADWAAQNNHPIFLGEFGAYNKADMDSRTRWTDAVARLAEEYGFSWAYWEFCSGFGVYDPEIATWREPLLQALLGEK